MNPQVAPLTKPPDFDAFWAETLAELPEAEHAIETSKPMASRFGCDLQELQLRSLGNKTIAAYALGAASEEPRPLVVHAHGYGSAYELQWGWARAGFNVVGVDIRGFGRSTGALEERSPWGHMLSGRRAPETHFLRGAVCDYMQAVRVAQRLFEGRTTRTIFYGVSFAGGLAVMAEGVLQQADLLVCGVPTFGWAEGRDLFVQEGSGKEVARFLETHPDEREDLMVVLRYFDAVNFAPAVRCPALVGLGLVDRVVPAETVRAIVSHLGGPVELMEFPVAHSEAPEMREWLKFEKRWRELGLEGVAEGFGALR